MMTYFTVAISFMATAVVLTGLSRTSPLSEVYNKFRKISADEDRHIHVWPPPSDILTVKNCGPPMSCSAHPWPFVLKQKATAECNITAAHTLIDGEITYKLNKWPYSYKVNACQEYRGLCPLKKGEMIQYLYKGVFHLNSDIYLGHLEGNVTLTNSEDEVIFCISGSANFSH